MGEWRRGLTCTRSHLGTLSNLSLTPGFVGGGVQHSGAKPVTLEAVRGLKVAGGRSAHSPAAARTGVSSPCMLTWKTGALQEWLFTQGKLEGSGWEKAAWLVSGRQSPAGSGIHSKFSALMANTRLLTPKGVSEESLRGTLRTLWVLCADLCSPRPLHTDPPTVGSLRDSAFWGRSATSVTLSTYMSQEPKSPPP